MTANRPTAPRSTSFFGVLRGLVLWFSLSFIAIYAGIIGYQALSANPAFAPTPQQSLAWAVTAALGVLGVFLAMSITRLVIGQIREIVTQQDYEKNGTFLFFTIQSFVVVIWTGITSAIGFRSIVAEFTNSAALDWVVSSLAGALAAFTVLGLWSGLINIVDREAHKPDENGKKPSRWPDFLMFLIIGLPCILTISTFTSVIGNAGDEAVLSHLKRSTETLERDLDKVIVYRTAETPILNSLNGLARELQQRSEQERLSGGETGFGGDGPIARWLERTSRDVKFMADQLSLKTIFLDEIDRPQGVAINDPTIKMEELRTRFKVLKSNVFNAQGNMNIDDLQRRFQAEYFDLVVTLTQLRDDSSISSVNNRITVILTDMGREIETQKGKTSLGDLGLSQREVLDRFESQMKTSFDLTRAEAQEIMRAPKPELQQFTFMSKPVAVFQYWWNISTIWFFAIVVDTSLILWAIWAMRHGQRRVFGKG